MKVKKAIESRRAYRSLDPVKITNDIISDLGISAQLSPSCFNYQPWKYVFIYDKQKLKELQKAITGKNKWVKRASLIIAVFSKQKDDCTVGEREYYLFLLLE